MLPLAYLILPTYHNCCIFINTKATLQRRMHFYVFFILLLLSINTSGQNTSARIASAKLDFTNISTKQGLSSRSVTDITQDANGMIWIATVDGINRLDGYRIKQFFNTAEDKGALFNSDRSSLNADFSNKLWVASQTGLVAYNFQTCTFHAADSLHATDLYNQKRIRLFRQKGTLWAFGHKFYYSIAENETVKQYSYSGTSTTIDTIKHAFSNYITQVKEDTDGTLWAINPIFIMKINPHTMRVTEYFKIKELSGEGDVQDIEIVGNTVYICTWGKGLLQYNIATKQMKAVPSCGKVCKDATLYDGGGKGAHLIVAGAPTNYQLNLSTLKSSKIENVPEARKVLLDKHNNLWFGTDEGVFVSQASNKYVTSISLKELIPATKYKEEITASTIFYDNKRNYAATIEGQGLLLFDTQWNFTNLKKNYGQSPKQKGLDNVRSLYTSNNITWLASHAGLSKCTQDLTIIKHFVPQYENPASDKGNVFNKIIPLPNGQLLIKGFSTLHIFDLKTETFTKSYYTSTDGKHQFVNDFLGKCAVDKDIVYLATDNGLKALNLSTDLLTSLAVTASPEPILDLLKNNDTLWLCTLRGLICYNINSKSSITYTRANGLPSNNIRHILQDSKGTIWLATANGLCAFDRLTTAFTNFSQRDGLVDNVLEYAFALDNDTNLIIAHRNYISIINTKILEQQDNSRQTIITELSVNGKPVQWQINKNGKRLVLPHDQNLLSLHFSVLDGKIQHYSHYYYNINGTWMASSTGQVQLSNLAPGTYTISLGSAPKDAKQNDFIIVQIMSPFYRTWWFYLLSAVLLGSLLYAVFRYRANIIRQQLGIQKDYELKIQNLEMQSLRSQMNPHFIFNTLNSINSFIIQNHTDLASAYLTKFSKLMRNILDHSKQETVSLLKELQTLQMYLELESVRLEHKFDYSIIVDKAIAADMLQVPSLIIQPFVENALWHGLRNKQSGGHIQVNIKAKPDNRITISISDDGIGRAAAGVLKKDQVQHKSYGIEITAARVHLLNPENSIVTTDLYTTAQIPCGTKVDIELKII
jgi:ligand-binding sensor domain-containing protein/anti-sigma regulatory factor (Ser/Thr protein kinase)